MNLKTMYLLTVNLLHKIKWTILVNVFGKRKIWIFDNGIKHFEDHLLGGQLIRYRNVNLHEPEEEKLFIELLENYTDGIFIDIGAAAGYYSFLSKKYIPNLEVHAFNPSKKFRSMFDENAELNNISGIKQYPQAITNYIGTCGLNSRWGSVISKKGEIPTTTLENFIKNLNKKVFLIKMDIQGEEVNALKGAMGVFDRIENLIVGTHGPKVHEECVKILKSCGYILKLNEHHVKNQPDGIIVACR